MKELERRQCPGPSRILRCPWSYTFCPAARQCWSGALFKVFPSFRFLFMGEKKCLMLSEFQCFRLQMTSLNLSSHWHSEFANIMSRSFFHSLGPAFYQLFFPVPALNFSSGRFLVPRPSWSFHPTLCITVQ